MNKKIEVLAGHTQTDVLNGQANYYRECDTIKKAKAEAKRYLTEDYRILAEASETMKYSQVLVDGECLYDFFAKGYNGESSEE
jgi:hypothetical protein